MVTLSLGSRRKALGAAALFACVLLVYLGYAHQEKLLGINNLLSALFPAPKDPDTQLRPKMETVLLPAGYAISASALRRHLQGTSSEEWREMQLNASDIRHQPPMDVGPLESHSATLFRASGNLECRKSGEEFQFSTDESQQLAVNFTNIFRIFNEETDKYNDSFNNHIYSAFKGYTSEKALKEHWFRFSGSSVWLKDYNVHFVVSRLVFSETKRRNFPTMSMLLAQVYDENWNEVPDVRLVVPTNDAAGDMAFEMHGQTFTLHRYPRILATPFDIGEKGQYWGAEDPRILLVKNKNGHDEPVVIYNSLNRPALAKRDLNEPYPRSMFMSFPFQLQKGKHLAVPETQAFDNQWFSRTNLLSIEGEKREHIEKNWTPFVSGAPGPHTHIYIATQLDPLTVLKCDLDAENAKCVYDGDRNKRAVGALRGGTPLLSLKVVPEQDKEFFVGLARAHLRDCGCGGHFYRPNLVLVARHGSKWSLSHVSSSIDLGMEVTLWNTDGKVCANNNAMIPNGIESFDTENDVLTVFASVSDATVERVHVTGILKMLDASDYSSFEEVEDSTSPVKCAMEVSKEFCKEYGLKHD